MRRFRSPWLYFLALLATVLLAAAQDDFVKPDTPPVPVRTPPPQYPQNLRRDGVTGIVTVAIVIDEKGSVVSAAINKSSNPDFEAPSLEAVKKWKFKPATKDNAPVPARVIVPLHFTVES